MDDVVQRRILRKLVGDKFRLNALMLKKDALEYCTDAVEKIAEDKRKVWLDRVIEVIRKQNMPSDCLTSEDLRNVILHVVATRSEKLLHYHRIQILEFRAHTLIKLFDAFSIPCVEYCPSKKNMMLRERKRCESVTTMTTAFRQRFLQVYQRVPRLKNFDGITFATVESLLAVSHRVDTAVIIGVLTQQKANTWYIEDLTGIVQAEFSPDTEFHAGIYTESNTMIFEGSYNSLLFTVKGVGIIPPEGAEQTRAAYGNTNWFGGDEELCFSSNNKLMKIGELHRDASMAVLSNVHLDNPVVLAALRYLFSGYSSTPPAAFVFCGNFCSRPRQPDTNQKLEKGFRRLADIIMEFTSSYTNTHFIFVPGPDDPPSQYILPRPPLPGSLFQHLKKVPNCSFASNPVRIQFASAEVVVFREDVIEKMCRHAVRVPRDAKVLSENAVHTILSQGHICPLPNHVSPVLWNYDDALRLLPLPEGLILADKFEAFSHKVKGCSVLNPSSFNQTPHEFMVYYPIRGETEPSQLGKLDTGE